MKIKFERKIKEGFILFFFTLTLISCSQKKDELKFKKGSKGQDFSFQIFKFNKTGKSNLQHPEIYYYPSDLDNFLMRHSYENGEFLYLFEKYYPDCVGLLDCEDVYSTILDNGSWVDNLLYMLEESELQKNLDNLKNDDFISPPLNFEEAKQEAENYLSKPVDFDESEGVDKKKSDDKTADENKENTSDSEKVSDESSSDDTPAEQKLSIGEKQLINSQNRLKLYHFEEEVFIPQVNKNGTVIVHKNKKSTVRIFYNNFFYLTKKEYWSINGTKDSKIILQEEYNYYPVDQESKEAHESGESKKYKISEQITKSQNKEVYSKYSLEGKLQEKKNFEINNEFKILTTDIQWNYDNEGRIIEETAIEYTVSEKELEKTSDENKNQEKKTIIPADTLKKTQKYNYNSNARKLQKDEKTENIKIDNSNNDKKDKKDGEKEIPPDYQYYENDVLKIETIYSAIGNYVQNIYFDESFSVSTEYVNNRKFRDTYFVDGIVRRIKNYEN